MIKIIGLGPGSSGDLTIKAIEVMKNAKKVYLRTFKHPNVDYIKKSGIIFDTFDGMYDSAEDFDSLYLEIANIIVNEEDVVYAVPGHPLVAEKSVEHIIKMCEQQGREYELITALSFIDAVISAVKIDPVKGLKIIDGLQLDTQEPDTLSSNIVTQMYNKFVASNIKIKLMDYYDDEQEVYIIKAAGVEGLERIEKVCLYEIDRVEWVDYLTSLYIPPCTVNKKHGFKDLVSIINTLRGENGCPWDREQTHESLEKCLIEECYEVIEAIRNKDTENLCEELGDLLLQVVFHSSIASDYDGFSIQDVTNTVTEKMIKRHPHIFSDVSIETSDDVLDNWEAIKMKEKNQESYTKVLKDIPMNFPGLLRAQKLQDKARKVGFDFDNTEETIEKITEELDEMLEAYKGGSKEEIEEEIGDLLFSIVNFSRFLKINSEICLTNTIEKFIKRFEYIENKTLENGKTISNISPGDMNVLWEASKSIRK